MGSDLPTDTFIVSASGSRRTDFEPRMMQKGNRQWALAHQVPNKPMACLHVQSDNGGSEYRPTQVFRQLPNLEDLQFYLESELIQSPKKARPYDDPLVQEALASQHLSAASVDIDSRYPIHFTRLRDGTTTSPTVQQGSFKPEFRGVAEAARSPASVSHATFRHGLVLDHLASRLGQLGWIYGNDCKRDLFAARSEGQPSLLFEIKTQLDPYSVYTAIGQLMLHSLEANWDPRPAMVAVLPSGLDTGTAERLEALGITYQAYNWKWDPENGEDRALFPSLEDTLRRAISQRH